ncbi:hypothetical protein P43SY_011242 [Pythium insidiosum]|uniref:CCHC-type domain-containing protein n=1 Tax=Pythium insidiosum TaxID=114742 RepID=A0AAD5L5H8_PYTIN|nr:hypothetical protein P43SY_011242 [Pythium insidiosum]
MSPTNSFSDLLTADNYFLWEFTERMTLARKGVHTHIDSKPEPEQLLDPKWKAEDIRALALIVKSLSPTFQTMVREASTAWEAWEILRVFFSQQNLHNRVQLRKQLSEFELEEGGNLMDHLLRFDELWRQIIEASNGVTLLSAKEMLRREYETLQRREKKEVALKAAAAALQADGSSNKNQQGRKGGKKQGKKGGNSNGQFRGKCFLCKQTGHKQANCPKKNEKSSDEFVFSVMDHHSNGVESTWLLDSGASSHMTGDVGDFVEYQDLPASIWVTVANGQRLEARAR